MGYKFALVTLAFIAASYSATSLFGALLAVGFYFVGVKSLIDNSDSKPPTDTNS